MMNKYINFYLELKILNVPNIQPNTSNYIKLC